MIHCFCLAVHVKPVYDLALEFTTLYTVSWGSTLEINAHMFYMPRSLNSNGISCPGEQF